MGKEIDSEVALDVFNGEVDKGFAVDNGGIVDENRWGTKLKFISKGLSKW